MTRRDPGVLLRKPGASQHVTLLELFYDLVYVASLAVISMNLARHLTWVEALQTLLPLMAIWWLWTGTALVTDFYDPQRLPIQGLIVAMMLGTIVLAATLPQAFGQQGIIFAGAYVAINLGRSAVLFVLLRGHDAQLRTVRFLFCFALSAVPWIAGGLVQGPVARGTLWAIAVAVEYVMGGLRYPTPRLGRLGLDQYDKAREHVGERYQQFMILALGDLILVATLGYNRAGLGAWHTVALLATFTATVALWQIYAYRAGSLLRNLPKGRRPGRVLRWAPYTHLLMIAGIVCGAAGSDLVLRQPLGSTPPGLVVAFFGGAFLFLIGRTTFEYEVFERFSVSRLAWLVVLIGVAPVMVRVAPVTVDVVHAAVLMGVAVSDVIRGRIHASHEAGRR